MRNTGALFLALALVACGEDDLPPGEIVLTLGQETDAWNGVETGVVETEDEAGDRSELLRRDAPLSRFEMGKGGITTFVVSGLDASGTAQARGRSLAVNRAGFAGIRLPLFLSRANAFARPPGNLAHAQPEHPPTEIVTGRYLYAFGGADGDYAQPEAYDFGSWRRIPLGSISCPTPPCRVRSFAVVPAALALVVGDDWGIALDLEAGGAAEHPKPTGLASYAEIAGGATIHADDGSAYLIGGTRPNNPTATVLHIDPAGLLKVALLTSPRAGASATWITGRGLVVVGGGDAQAAGAELLAEGSTAFVPLAFPPDRTTGAALVSVDGSSALRIGGRNESGTVADSVSLALGCGTACTPVAAGPAVDLPRVSAFALPSGRVLVIGDDEAGDTQVSSWSENDVISVPLREPRRGATAIAAPTGHVAIAGGTHQDGSPALSLELFIE